jgi:transposase, IS5 family
VNDVGLETLGRKHHRLLLVVTEVNRQQLYMYEHNENRIDDRIVSLTEPHVRPIVRGKAGTPVEFGAKLSASCVNGYVFLDRISWNNFNESGDLKNQVEEFKKYTGAYPESVHADKIYRTKVNRDWCKERGIRLSGIRLGRPPKTISKEVKKQARLDETVRNCIEGKFGEAKRRFSLNRVMTKLANTSETAIAISFLAMNLSALLRQLFGFFMYGLNRDTLYLCFADLRLDNIINQTI